MIFKKNKQSQEDSKPSVKKESPDLISLALEFIEERKNRLDQIRSIAIAGGTEWDKILIHYSVEHVPQLFRDNAKKSGLIVPAGAFPREYREVLIELRSQLLKEIEAFIPKVKSSFDAEDKVDDFRRYFVEDLEKEEMKKYLDKAKPAVRVSDIFANASTSINKYSVKEENQGDKSYSIKCKSCGAARLEEDQYDNCFYCGAPLFE